LRVLAVGGRGLVALYRPDNEDSSRADAEAAAEKAVAAAAAAAAAVTPQVVIPQSDAVVDHSESSSAAPSSEHKLPPSPQVNIRSIDPAFMFNTTGV